MLFRSPDIDYNIRYGNTLVGYASEEELDQAFLNQFDFDNDKEKIKERCDTVARTFGRYKEIQMNYGDDFQQFKQAKTDLEQRLQTLNYDLNVLLHKQSTGLDYNIWLKTHQPFHWLAEFYEIIHDKGGFDVIIGNPPYLEIRQIGYKPTGLMTLNSGAVHCMCVERSLQLLKKNGNISMIIPLAVVCTQRMTIVQKLLEKERVTWYSNFAWRPGKLFENVNRALTIFVANFQSKLNVYSTGYLKWQSDTRCKLFPNVYYTAYNEKRNSFWVPKLSSNIEIPILTRLLDSDCSINKLLINNSLNKVYYRTTGGLYWKVFTDFPPKFYLEGNQGKSSRETFFSLKEEKHINIVIALLSSNIFWWWYTVTSNLRDLNPSDIQGLRFPSSLLTSKSLIELGKKYIEDIKLNSVMLTRVQKQTGETETQSFRLALSKSIINEIDIVLAKHYGFTPEELDFIINYDIKYRMGKELGGDEDE